MKEKLTGALGTFGMIIWYLISFLYSFFPIVILYHNIPGILRIILIGVMLFAPFIGEIVRIVLYVWATVVAIKGPFDTIAIIFYVFAILYFATTLLPFIKAFIPKKKE